MPYSGDTTVATPPVVDHDDSPRSSSPIIASGFSSSSQSPNDSPPQQSRLGKVKSVLPYYFQIENPTEKLAPQFQSASNKKRLILGSYITQLAVSLKLLDLSNTNMHIACHMEPLDIDSLCRMGIMSINHGRATFTSLGPTVQPKKRKRRDMEEPMRDTTSSTPETSNMPSFSRHLEDRLNRIEFKLDRILAHFHIPPD
ncbi:hypothetical protein BUALT_Bualt12G0083500 [Buddleja alternifolia]|uniref:Uncharacterized protein n=1 Tax=Buddleja alternifolia TaxID=168488 RepID=A0AAV6X098_9LAMI|nr:hypothetical protein BUALT_Bualt12G0083500 [Buddleja alternifolia]